MNSFSFKYVYVQHLRIHKFPPNAWKHLFKLKNPCGLYYERQTLLLGERATCSSCALFMSFYFIYVSFSSETFMLSGGSIKGILVRFFVRTYGIVCTEQWNEAHCLRRVVDDGGGSRQRSLPRAFYWIQRSSDWYWMCFTVSVSIHGMCLSMKLNTFRIAKP